MDSNTCIMSVWKHLIFRIHSVNTHVSSIVQMHVPLIHYVLQRAQFMVNPQPANFTWQRSGKWNVLKTFQTCQPWTFSVSLSRPLFIGLDKLCKVIGWYDRATSVSASKFDLIMIQIDLMQQINSTFTCVWIKWF